MTELAELGANLFGALIARELDPGSELYNRAVLFPLSLPALDDDPRDIFSASRTRVKKHHRILAQEGKENLPVSVFDNIDDTKQSASAEPSANVPRYFSLAQGLPVLPSNKFATNQRITMTEEDVNNMVLLALKGTSSDLFRVDRKPPLVTIAGRSVLSVQHYLLQIRSIFVVRTLLGCACEGFVCYGADSAGLAVGDQLGRFLHLFDTSLSAFSKPVATTINTDWKLNCDHNTEKFVPTAQHNSMIVLLEQTKLHRAFLCHLFSILRPNKLKCIALDALGTFVSDDREENKDDAVNTICEFLKPRSWAQIAGWNILHTIVDTFSLARSTTWTIHTTPIFKHNVFRNASEFCPMDLHDKTNLNLDFSRMLLTGILARQVAAPLLLELKAKLFDLDDEFYAQDGVRADELQDSLLISIDALWVSFMNSEADNDCVSSGYLNQDQDQEDRCGDDGGKNRNQNDNDNRNGRRAARCIEFLLGALAWARGRVALMLLEPGVDPAVPTAVQAGIASFQRQSAAVAMRRVRMGSLQVRDKPTGHVVTAGEDSEIAFDRQAVIDAFRSINPQLLLPLSPSDEDLMSAVREQSLTLHADVSEKIELKMHQWHLSFATLSDYYNENAVSVRTLFAKASSPTKPRPSADNGVSNAPRDRVSLVQQKLDRESRKANHSEAESAGATMDPNTETYLSGPLNTPHTVSKDLVEAAKDHIRAKYEALMRQVDARSSAATWANKRQESLSEARTELTDLFRQDAAELDRLRGLKNQDSESYQRHFDDQLQMSPALPVLPLPTEDPIPSRSSFLVVCEGEIAVTSLDAETNSAKHNIAQVSTDFLTAATENDADEVEPELTYDLVESGVIGDLEPVPSVSSVESNCDEVDTNYGNVAEQSLMKESPHQPSNILIEAPTAAPTTFPEAASHSLVDIAPQLLGHTASGTPSTAADDDDVLSAVQSLVQSLLLLGSTHGLITHSSENLKAELKELVQENPGSSLDKLYEALLKRAAQPVSNLHSLHSVLMRSLGRAVLAQCQVINLASLHCLINSSVDLLGHIQAVDNLLLVSPNSDFLMSLCTLMVEQHLQNVRVLHRQGGAAISSLSPLLRDQSNANLWNNEALQVGFTSVLANATSANQWKEFGTLYSTMRTAEEASSVGESVGAITMRWAAGLFSASALTSLSVQYDAPWPVPAIITPQVLSKLTCITRRFLELGQLVALFRVVWGELRIKRVMSSKKKPTGRARPPQVDRQISDSMRLVQQTVQHLFDYLSERVYVHQARFKQAMRRASTHGLDAVVNALNTYSKGLCDASLQLSPDESAWMSRARNPPSEISSTPGELMASDPSVSLKADINSMLECCRRVLSVSKSLNDANLQDGSRGDSFHGAVTALQENAHLVQRYRKSLVEAAMVLNANGNMELDLQPLIMRFEVCL